MRINDIRTNPKVFDYLKKRNLESQFYKSVDYIYDWFYSKVDLKLRKPKTDSIYSFRINKQFRAFARLIDGCLYIYDINNHQ